MSKTNNFVFTVVQVVSWIIFVGLSIEAGALLVNFVFSIFKPVAVHNLYQKLDLSQMYNRSKLTYYNMYSFLLVISILKAILFYVVIRLLLKINLMNPFDSYVSRQISLMSYYTFSIGILSYIAKEATRNLMHKGFDTNKLNEFWSDSQAFILMAAVIYVIAIIFERGVELQNENELTV